MRIDSGHFRSGVFAVLVAGAAVFASAAHALDQKGVEKVKVFCFVQQDSSGFIDQRTTDLQDSLKDIREAIVKKRDWLQLVEAREQADVVLEVTERTLVERMGELQTTTTHDKDGKRSTSTTKATKEHDVVLRGLMRVGDYKDELTGRCDLGYLFGGAYRQAAKNLVGSLEDWVKKNYTRLQLKKRS